MIDKFLSFFRYFVLFFGVLFSCGSWASESRIAHIYIDLATIPALFQMVDAVKQPSNEPKLFIWKRFPTLPPEDLTLKELNATMADAKVFGEYNYDIFNDFIDQQVGDFYKKYQDYSFVLHLNLYHASSGSGHLFKIIPDNQIQGVHLYEDAIARSYWDRRTEGNFLDIETSAPKYLHLGFYVREDLSLEERELVLMDIHEISEKLSDHQKKQIANLVGLDLSQLSQKFSKKPTVVFVDDPSLSLEEARAFLEKLFQNEILKEYTWLYKNHPRVSRKSNVFYLLSEYVQNIFVIPNSVPLEALILCGYNPTYIAGYGSSVFFSFKPEQVLGYIKRNYLETYLGPLLDFGILTSEKVFSKPK